MFVPAGVESPPLDAARALAAAAAGLLELAVELRAARVEAEQLQGCAELSSRVVIEQAKGILAERAQVSLDCAFASLRRYARTHSRRLVKVCDALTRHDPDLPDIPIVPTPIGGHRREQLRGWPSPGPATPSASLTP